MLLAALCAIAPACATPVAAPDLSRWLAEAPQDRPAVLWLRGDRIVRAIAPLGPGATPQVVRRRADEAAPGGEFTLMGREWGPLGNGFRLERLAADGQATVRRTMLIDEQGRLLDFGQSVPLVQAPQHVLAAALAVGRDVVEATLFAHPGSPPRWECRVVDALGHTHLVTIDLDGRRLATLREVAAVVRV